MATVYLDYNASAPARSEAVDAMLEALGRGGNPSSVHVAGRRARALVEEARETVAALVGAKPAQVIFTSGGTEAMALACHGLPEGPRLVSAIEHACVLAAAAGAEQIPVTKEGTVDLAWLERRLAAEPIPAVVAVMLANNETGVIQPVARVAELARSAGALVVCDAVQGAGKIHVDLETLGVDALALSAHKLGGPQGVGALVVREPERLMSLIAGGGQERGKRGGTPNTPGIAGFGAAVRAIDGGEAGRVRRLRDALERELRAIAPDIVIWGEEAERLPNTTCVGLPGVEQQRQLMALDLAGVAVSAGSACSSGKTTASHVLRAMGADEATAREAIRVSLGWASTQSDIDAFLTAWARLARQGRSRVRAAT